MQLQIKHIDSTQDRQGQVTFNVKCDEQESRLIMLNSPWEITIGTKSLRNELKWYLEEYLDMPVGAYRTRADQVQVALLQWGRECFCKLLRDSNNDYSDLRITIISDDAVVLSWPWEAITYKHDTIQQCFIERQINIINDVSHLSKDSNNTNQLNILYIIARPDGENDVEFQTLARPIINFVEEENWSVNIDVLRPPTFDQLRNVLHENPNFYHIVHFDGHGCEKLVDKHGNVLIEGGVLKFENVSGAAEYIPASTFSLLLGTSNVPYVILNACESATFDESSADPFASVATALLGAGVHGVVAMSYSLRISGAKAFVPVFYRTLLTNGDVAEAIQSGRREMLRTKMRDTFKGQTEFHDWIVPVLYQQGNQRALPKLSPCAERRSCLPLEAQVLDKLGFIGRDREIQRLERILRRDSTDVLIHGMVGEGKTTLVKGFLQWLEATNGLGKSVLWFDYSDIHSILNKIASAVIPEKTDIPVEKKQTELIQTLRCHSFIIVFDNVVFKGKDDHELLNQFLDELRGGKTKILITARSPDVWSEHERFLLPLNGLKGEEYWQYCHAVMSDDASVFIRENEIYGKLVDRLDGNPLAVRLVLPRLKRTVATELLSSLKSGVLELNDGSPTAHRLVQVFTILDGTLEETYAPVLRLIGLHEQFVVAHYVTGMLKEIDKPVDMVENCFNMLERYGLCHKMPEIIESGYRIHPLLQTGLFKYYSSGEIERCVFARFIAVVCDVYKRKPFQEQEVVFELFNMNFQNALKISEELELQDQASRLLSGLGLYSFFKSRDFEDGEELIQRFVDEAESIDSPHTRASAYHQRAIIAFEQGDFEAAKKLCEKVLAAVPEDADKIGTAQTYCELGHIAYAQHDLDEAKSWYEKAKLLLPSGSEDAAIIYHELGRIFQEQGDFNIAKEYYENALKISQNRKYKQREANTHHQLGMLAEQQGDFDTAVDEYEYAASIRGVIGDKYEEAKSYFQLGRVEMQRPNPNYDIAEENYNKSLNIVEKMSLSSDNYNIVALAYGELGLIAMNRDHDYNIAQEWLTRASDLLGDDCNARYVYYRLSVISEKQGNLVNAEMWLKRALTINLEIGNEHEAAMNYFQLHTLALKSENYAVAEGCMITYIQLLRKNSIYYGVRAIETAEEILDNIMVVSELAKKKNNSFLKMINKRKQRSDAKYHYRFKCKCGAIFQIFKRHGRCVDDGNMLQVLPREGDAFAFRHETCKNIIPFSEDLHCNDCNGLIGEVFKVEYIAKSESNIM